MQKAYEHYNEQEEKGGHSRGHFMVRPDSELAVGLGSRVTCLLPAAAAPDKTQQAPRVQPPAGRSAPERHLELRRWTCAGRGT